MHRKETVQFAIGAKFFGMTFSEAIRGPGPAARARPGSWLGPELRKTLWLTAYCYDHD